MRNKEGGEMREILNIECSMLNVEGKNRNEN